MMTESTSEELDRSRRVQRRTAIAAILLSSGAFVRQVCAYDPPRPPPKPAWLKKFAASSTAPKREIATKEKKDGPKFKRGMIVAWIDGSIGPITGDGRWDPEYHDWIYIVSFGGIEGLSWPLLEKDLELVRDEPTAPIKLVRSP